MSSAPAVHALPGPMAPRGGDSRFEPLSWWRNAGRLALAWFLGLMLFSFYISPLIISGGEGVQRPEIVVTVLAVDLIVGHLALVLVAFRRRAPVLIAALVMAASAASVFAAPAGLLAAMSLATKRRLRPLIWLGLLNLASGAVNENLLVPLTALPGYQQGITGQGWLIDGAVYVVFATLVYGVAVLIGWNVGSRRELVTSWRTQAETANREQAARVAQAQLAERARIAREMHDVLAHRLSLVAMHAGVLAHRTDLSASERTEAAEVVREGTHQALQELREVLGVLRDDASTEPAVAPQPSLSGIPTLVAEVTSSGQEVRLVADEALWPRSTSLPSSTGRHAYRVVQESLTNARRHASGVAVTVTVDGGPGEGLSIVVRNPVPPTADGTLAVDGRGLAGMAERVQLAGGRFEAGVEVTAFVVRAWLPWPEGASEGD